MKKIHLLLICILSLWCTACAPKDDAPVITISLDDCDIVLNKINAGSFLMGSDEGLGEEDELPVRQISITEDFYMGVYEITQAQWIAVMGTNPSNFSGNNLPVETVNWNDANAFCQKLSEISGFHISLPTEAQWEYACRADTTTKWFFGDSDDLYGIYGETDTNVKTYPVGSFEPNPNGLYDMYGNVMEWCLDYYSPSYVADDITNPIGPFNGNAKVSRGGGLGSTPDTCRSGYRNACSADCANDGIGFRIVINP